MTRGLVVVLLAALVACAPSPPPERRRVVVVGIDGADWKVIDGLRKELFVGDNDVSVSHGAELPQCEVHSNAFCRIFTAARTWHGFVARASKKKHGLKTCAAKDHLSFNS